MSGRPPSSIERREQIKRPALLEENRPVRRPLLDHATTLSQRGADVVYTDPHVPTFPLDGLELKAVELTEEILRQADCTLILTDHPEFDFRRIVEVAPLVVDTRNATWGITPGRVIRF